MKRTHALLALTGRQNAVCLIIVALVFFALSCANRHPAPVDTGYPLSQWNGTPVVTTLCGAVRGFPDKENTYSWKGIPYARPPVGDLRWRSPVPHWPWKGTLDASAFGPAAPQFIPVVRTVAGSEDCLFLNVWRPQSEEQGLPVYVWVHGGGNSIGSAHSVPDYYGHAMATRSNTIFVSINYRLGILGWLYHPGIGDGIGNYGTLDIIAALQWVRQNIAAFGGDPERVTIAGESAGAMNILSLMLSPRAVGLFERAVVQSGTQFFWPKEKAFEFTRHFVVDLLVRDKTTASPEEAEKLADAMEPARLRSYLASKSVGQLFSVLTPDAAGMTDTPAIIGDGEILPVEGYALFDSGEYPVRVPIIIGSNKEETKLFLSFDDSLDFRGPVYQALGKYGSLRWKVDGVDSIAEKISRRAGRPPVYVYRFDWGAANENNIGPLSIDLGKKYGAFHSLEIPFFLGTDTIFGSYMTGTLFNKANREGRHRLSESIMAYLASFVHTADPNAVVAGTVSERVRERPRWEPWNVMNGRAPSLVFDVRGDAASLSVIYGVLTRMMVDRQMREELPADILRAIENKFIHP